ncbi:MAG: hypothetical protein NTX45_27545 [Proteobacteria bacterium]|nr:hypothetical protein [Pseudomonadota bacterium]
MFAERLIIETDAKGKPTCLPELPPNSKMEAIFLLLEEPSTATTRQASPAIAGKGKILGDIVSPIIPELLSDDTQPFDHSRLLSFLEYLEQLPFSVRTTEEMNADIQAERDAWD